MPESASGMANGWEIGREKGKKDEETIALEQPGEIMQSG